jgi:hypothetical protein
MLNIWPLECDHINVVIQCVYTVKPVLTATSEQRPPVYNGQLEPPILQNVIVTNC